MSSVVSGRGRVGGDFLYVHGTLSGRGVLHVISVICYLTCICSCTSYSCEMVVGLGADLHTVRGVGGMGIRMLTLGTEASLDTEDRGLQVLMVLENDHIPHTYKCFFRSYDLLDLSTQILNGV